MSFDEFQKIVGDTITNRCTLINSNAIQCEDQNERVIYNIWDFFNGKKDTETNETGQDIQQPIETPTCSQQKLVLADVTNDLQRADIDGLQLSEERQDSSKKPFLDDVTGELRYEEIHCKSYSPSSDITIEPIPSTSRCTEPSKKITVLSSVSLSDYLKKKMWPGSPKRKGKRQTERVPFALTSDDYLRIMQEKTTKKEHLLKEKETKKRIREEKKNLSKKNKGVGKKSKIETDIHLEENKEEKNETTNTTTPDNLMTEEETEHTETMLSVVNRNSYADILCDGCSRRMNGKKGLKCGVCEREFHSNCVPSYHRIHIPNDDEDEFMCHLCYRLNTSGSSTDECFDMFQEEAKKHGF